MNTQEAREYIQQVDAAERRMNEAATDVARFARRFLDDGHGKGALQIALIRHTSSEAAFHALASELPE